MLILLIMTIYNNYLYKLIYNFLRVYKNSPIVQIFGYVYIFKLLLKTLFYSNTIFKLYISSGLSYNRRQRPYAFCTRGTFCKYTLRSFDSSK